MYNNQTMCPAYNLIKMTTTLHELLLTSKELEDYQIESTKLTYSKINYTTLLRDQFKDNYPSYLLNKEIPSLEEYISHNSHENLIDPNFDIKAINHELLKHHIIDPINPLDFLPECHGKICDSIDNQWVCGC